MESTSSGFPSRTSELPARFAGTAIFCAASCEYSWTSLANPLPTQPASTALATAFIPQNSHFVGISGNEDPNNPANAALFKNAAGQLCGNFGGTATNCSINLASFSSVPPNAKAPYNQEWHPSVQRDLENRGRWKAATSELIIFAA